MNREKMSLICVSLIDRTVSSVIASADKCKSLGADIIEVRFYRMKEPQFFPALKELSKLKEKTGLPVLLTIRPTWEGGNFEKDEEQRLALLEEGIENGFDYIDLELKMDEIKRNELISKAKKNGVKTMVSYHDFQQTPTWKEIFNQIKECANAGGDIAKVVYYNHSINDALNVLKAGSAAKNFNHTFTVMGMGSFGQITRILAPVIGCEVIYTAMDKEKGASEAQIDIGTLKEIWDILDINRVR